MQEKFAEIKIDINANLKDLGIYLDNITFVTEGSYRFLRITLDKAGGLDLDAIVEASNIINKLIDKYDENEESYILDILSKEQRSGV